MAAGSFGAGLAPALAMPAASPRALSVGERRVVLCAVVLACCYPLLLVGIHTNVLRLGAAAVGVAEGLILALCLPLLLRRVPGPMLALLVGMLGMLGTLWLLRGAVDFKSARDLAIPALFLWLGSAVGERALAQRALFIVAGVTLVVALVELLFVDVYARYFNILSYYISQGVVPESYQQDVALNVNGVRPEGIGRTLFPALLGSHRVSSIFIEPVSMGNFATLLAAWGLSRPSTERGTIALALLLAWALIVLADSRYGLVVVTLMAAMRLTLVPRWQGLGFGFPFIAVTGICALAIAFPHHLADDFVGRLALGGRSVLELGWAGLLGLEGWAARHGDAGYAYLFTRFGLPLALGLWLFLWLLPMRDEAAARLRAHVSLYIALILTVSGTSLFAMKTSALLWFLIGVSVASRFGGTTEDANAGAPRAAAPSLSDPVTGRSP